MHGIDPKQVDVWKIHEAFSTQARDVLRQVLDQLDGYHVPDYKLTPTAVPCRGHRASVRATGVPYALILATALRQRRLRSGAAGERIGSGQRVISVELWTLGAGALELPNVRVGGEGY